jgi:hypothetical protein
LLRKNLPGLHEHALPAMERTNDVATKAILEEVTMDHIVDSEFCFT